MEKNEGIRNVYQSPSITKEQTEMKNAVEGINSRITGRRRGHWSRRQNGGSHCHKTEYRKKEKKKEHSQRDLWDNIKNTNIHIIRVPKGEERKHLRKCLK